MRVELKKTRPAYKWLTLILLIAILLVIHGFIVDGWSTGFGSGKTTEKTITETSSTGKTESTVTKTEPGKTLWDWLDLLIIPAVLAIGASLINNRNQRIEREIASDRNQEAAFQAYLDRMMTELLLKKEDGLRDSQPEGEVRTVARTCTLTVLRGLDGVCKGTFVHFFLRPSLFQQQRCRERAQNYLSLLYR